MEQPWAETRGPGVINHPEHMISALKVAFKLQLLVPAMIIHSIAPRFFTRTASNTLRSILNNRENADKP